MLFILYNIFSYTHKNLAIIALFIYLLSLHHLQRETNSWLPRNYWCPTCATSHIQSHLLASSWNQFSNISAATREDRQTRSKSRSYVYPFWLVFICIKPLAFCYITCLYEDNHTMEKQTNPFIPTDCFSLIHNN